MLTQFLRKLLNGGYCQRGVLSLSCLYPPLTQSYLILLIKIMKKIYKLRYSHYSGSGVIVHNLVNICSSSEYNAFNSIIKAHTGLEDLISVELIEVIDFVDID